jgi:hypothetical protein
MEVHGDVDAFLKGRGLYIADQKDSPTQKLNEYASAFIELTQFKDPKSDFDLLAGRFVEVKTRLADGTERFYHGRVGQEGGKGSFVVLKRAGECCFDPVSTKEEIVSIYAYSPHAEFGGKGSLINGKPEAIRGRIGGPEKLFRELFPVGTSIEIPLEYKTEASGVLQPAMMKLNARILGYSAAGMDRVPRHSVLLEIDGARITLNIEDLVKMSLESNDPIRTKGYREQSAKAARSLSKNERAGLSEYERFYDNFELMEEVFTGKGS